MEISSPSVSPRSAVASPCPLPRPAIGDIHVDQQRPPSPSGQGAGLMCFVSCVRNITNSMNRQTLMFITGIRSPGGSE